MFWHAIRVGVCIFLSTHSSGMNFKFLISVGMFRLAVKVEVCILSATPSSGMNRPFSRSLSSVLETFASLFKEKKTKITLNQVFVPKVALKVKSHKNMFH